MTNTEWIQAIPSNHQMIGYWLAICCGLIAIIIVIGGLTRLTESGLSITEWRPVTGSIPPWSDEEWQLEFEKYKNYPQHQYLNINMTLDEFKYIFFWEWMHRFLGRVAGLTFGLPLAYFIVKRQISPSVAKKLSLFFALGGAQGLLGWYMVKSGLEVKEGDIPRVSAYRLCAHLGSAFIIYAGLLWISMGLLRPYTIVKELSSYTTKALPKWFNRSAGVLSGLTFLTIMSGAFVAGLDAGLVYNEFPYMGEGFIPEEYWQRQPRWRNWFENDAAVQFNHRILGLTTFSAINLFYLITRKQILSISSRYALNSMVIVSWVQVTLGLTTLLYFVPIPLASAHQAGSLTLLTCSIWFLHTLMRKSIRIRI